MKLQNIRQLVRQKLDDMQFDVQKIDSAVNWFIAEILNNNRISFMETSARLPFVGGVIEISLPKDLQIVTFISVDAPDATPYSITDCRVEYDDFMKRFPNFFSAPPQKIHSWTYCGKNIRFAAPTSSPGSLFIDYVKRPSAVTNGEDTLVIPDNYEEMVVIGATARVMEMNEDYAEAAQERQNLAPLVTAFVRNEARGQQKTGPIIMRTNRRRRSSEW